MSFWYSLHSYCSSTAQIKDMLWIPAKNFQRVHWIHTVPVYIYWFVCVCVYKKQLSVDSFPHAIHTWCTMIPIIKFLLCMNFLGIPVNSLLRKKFLIFNSPICFSSAWVLWCIMSCDFQQKAFPHSVHLQGFSPVWVLWCALRIDFWEKVFPHSLHS